MSSSLGVVRLPAHAPEDVAVITDGPDKGAVYCGTEDGTIWRVSADGASVEKVAHTGGRPLGIEIALDGRLIVCDSERGVLRVSPTSGAVEVLADELVGKPFRFPNNASIADDGTIWFSDSSTKFGFAQWRDDFVQGTRTGRLLRLDPSGILELAVTGLQFANGVQVSRSGDSVFVAETAGRSIVRYWVSGPREYTHEPFVTDLPGYPNNLSRGSDGLLWVSIASPTTPIVEWLKRAPMWVRQAITKIPERLQPNPKRVVRALAYDDDGRLVHDVDIKTRKYHMVTGCREFEGRLWMGSLQEHGIAVVDLA